MMLQNLRDPGTPYWGAMGMRTALGQRARLVSIDQGGHGVYELTQNQCANDSATAWLVEGKYPASDTYCPAEATTSTALPPQLNDAVNRSKIIREMVRRMVRP
jgi:hypothetical protein